MWFASFSSMGQTRQQCHSTGRPGANPVASGIVSRRCRNCSYPSRARCVVATALDNLDWTPLHEISYRGHFEIACLFLGHGADANVKDSELVTPLHQAAHWGHLEIVRALLERGADPTAQNHKGRGTFQIASAQKHPDIMQLLLGHGAE